MTIKEIQQELIDEFGFFSGWEERYKYIIDLGKELEPYPEEHRTDKYKITGCQSQVWLYPEFKDGKLYFKGDSDAMIVKGLVALLLRVYSGHTPEEILSNPPEFLKRIGIDKHLSPTRNNGLNSMLKQIQLYALAYKTLSGKKTGQS